MIIWLIFATLTACAILAVARPLGQARAIAAPAESEIEAYKLQLQELARDAERGTFDREEAAHSRVEIARRILRAKRRSKDNRGFERSGVSANLAFVVVAGVISAATIGLYAEFGSPGLFDQPLEARLAAPPNEQSLDIQVANVERRLRARPDDALGWTVIAPVYFRTGQFEKAADAFRKAMALAGKDEDKLLGYAEALTFANNGVVPENARPALAEAARINPKSLRARFWLGVLAEQDGNKEEAEHIFQAMLREDIPQAWRNIVSDRLASLTPGAAAASVPDGDQGEMIRGMVARLAERLQRDKGDLEGWLRLIRSYAVLHEPAKGQAALESARQQFAADDKALRRIEALADELGIQNKGAPAAVNNQSALIRGMVERLAARLNDDKGDLDGWLMLIRSYAVLKEPAKAKEAAATAKKQFAADAEALARIASLAHEAGLDGAAEPGGAAKP